MSLLCRCHISLTSCIWLLCCKLWRWGMVATALSVAWMGVEGAARTRQGAPSAPMDGKPALQPHWLWAEKVNNCKGADVILQGTLLWIRQTAQCGSTFHRVPGQSLLPGPPSTLEQCFLQDSSLGFDLFSATQANCFSWEGIYFYAFPPWKNAINTELLVVSPIFYKIMLTAPYLSENKKENKSIGYRSLAIQSVVNLRVSVFSHGSEGKSSATILDSSYTLLLALSTFSGFQTMKSEMLTEFRIHVLKLTFRLLRQGLFGSVCHSPSQFSLLISRGLKEV